MNKVTEMFLQYLRHNQEKVKHQKVSLIAKYQKCNKVDENVFATVNDKPNTPLQEEKPKKVYVRDMKNKYEIKRKHIFDWIANFKPTHFLIIQFPMNMRSPGLNVSRNHLRPLMARFEQHLVGSRWTGRHVRFYAFAEKGQHDGYSYHFHILLHCVRYSDDLIEKALDSACWDLSLSPKTYYIEKVEDNEVIYYCLKDIKTFDKTDWYDRIIPSNILFNIKW